MREQEPKQKNFSESFKAWLLRVRAWVKRTANKIKLKSKELSLTWRNRTWPKIRSRVKAFFRSVSALFKDSKQKSSKAYKEQKKRQQLSDIRSKYNKESDLDNAEDTVFDATGIMPPHAVTSLDNTPEATNVYNFDPLAAEDEAAAAAEAEAAAQPKSKDAKTILMNTTHAVKESIIGFSTRLKDGQTRRKQAAASYKPYQYKGLRNRFMRHGRQKVYRLKGYTTVARVNRKRRREYMKRQRNVLLLTALFLIIVIVIFMWIDPIPKLQNILHDIGFISNETVAP